jgi:hypothetical protein
MRLLGLVCALALAMIGCGEVKSGGQDGPPPPGDGSDGGSDAPSDVPMVPGTAALVAQPANNGDTIGLCATGTFGWHFIPGANATKIVALSVFDFQPAGLLDPHEVAIFDINGSLMARATVSSNAPLVAGFRTVSIVPITLTPNTTYVVAMTNPGQAHTSATGTCSDVYAHTDQNPGAVVVNSAITYKGVASEDTTNAPNPTALVFPNQFPPSNTTSFRVGPSFEIAAP